MKPKDLGCRTSNDSPPSESAERRPGHSCPHWWACLWTAGPRGRLCRQLLGHMEGREDKFKHDCALQSWQNQGPNPHTDAPCCAPRLSQRTPGKVSPHKRRRLSRSQGRLSLLGQKSVPLDASGHSPRRVHAERAQPRFFVNPPHQMPRTSEKKEMHT